jgi:hypothetical protein
MFVTPLEPMNLRMQGLPSACDASHGLVREFDPFYTKPRQECSD